MNYGISWTKTILLTLGIILIPTAIALADSPFGARVICRFGGPCRVSTLSASSVNDNGTLTVAGTSTLNGNVTIASGKSLTDNGSLSVTGSSTLANTTVTGTVTGTAGSILFNGQLVPNPSLSIGGFSSHAGTIYTTGLVIGANTTGSNISSSILYNKTIASTPVGAQSCTNFAVQSGTFTDGTTCAIGGTVVQGIGSFAVTCIVTTTAVSINACNVKGTTQNLSGTAYVRVFVN